MKINQTPNWLYKTKEPLKKSTAYSNSVNTEQVLAVQTLERSSTALANPHKINGYLQALDDKVNSMMEKSQNMIPDGKRANGTPKRTTATICKVCGKEGLVSHIRNHIEANHLEGISIPCDHCGKAHSSRNALSLHKGRFHK